MQKNLFFLLPIAALACNSAHHHKEVLAVPQQVGAKHLSKEKTTPIVSKKAPSITQGIRGFVAIATGNMMPMKGEPAPQPQPFATQVAIFPVLNRQDIAQHNSIHGLYTVAINPIATTYANAKGEFEMALPVGSYSVLAKKDGYWYGNSFNEMHQLQVVTVVKQQISPVQIVISTDAVY